MPRVPRAAVKSQPSTAVSSSVPAQLAIPLDDGMAMLAMLQALRSGSGNLNKPDSWTGELQGRFSSIDSGAQSMSPRPRPIPSPAFKAKVALAAVEGEATLTELAQHRRLATTIVQLRD